VKVFHCDHCGHLIFFENVRCVQCDHPLAFLPDLGVVGSLEPDGPDRFRSPFEGAKGRSYRLCENYSRHQVCNWAVPADDPNPLCRSCRMTTVIPDLDPPGHKQAWFALENAKRRLIYSLLHLHLPIESRTENPDEGLAFEFKADAPGAPVLTRHAKGLITINIAEADDAEREKRRLALHEPYRTLLGHFRHESGHYYWDRLIAESHRLEAFRAQFGDERADYAVALKRNYDEGPPADWQARHISSYASIHPWEDWAETWAHYLHMTDLLQTAADSGLSLRPRRPDVPVLTAVPDPLAEQAKPFDRLIDTWFPLTYVLNNLNRSMGLVDAYPFVWSPPAIEKLRFVHDTIE
jgi:hypothetical protein